MIHALLEKIQGRVPWDKKRSSHWPVLRQKILAQNPSCSACGGTKKLEVHHILPFHLDHSLELEPSNLIVLCESWNNGVNCHLAIGHLGSFKSYNKSVSKDAPRVRQAIQNRPNS